MVKVEKRILDALLLKMRDRVITIRGLVALSMFQGSQSTIVIPDLKA